MKKAFLDHCDVLLVLELDDWIFTICNSAGRRAVERIFLDLPIKWVPATDLSITRERDWSVANLNVEAMVKATEDSSRMIMMKTSEAYEPSLPQDCVLAAAFSLAIYEQDKRLRIIIAEVKDKDKVVYKRLRVTIAKTQ